MQVCMHSYLQFLCEMVSDDGCERGEKRSKEHTDVPDLDRDVEEMKDVINQGRCNHQSRIDGSSYNTTQRIPSSIIEPVVKIVKSFLSEKAGCSIVEVAGKEREVKNQYMYLSYSVEDGGVSLIQCGGWWCISHTVWRMVVYLSYSV